MGEQSKSEQSVTHTVPECERQLLASSAFDRFRCEPPVFTCVCGVRWVHICDEAEGCSWAREDGTRS
jgi:hypothetical protein